MAYSHRVGTWVRNFFGETRHTVLSHGEAISPPPSSRLGPFLGDILCTLSGSYLAIFEAAVNADVCHQNYVLKEGDVDFLHVTLCVFTTRIAHC